MDIVKIQTSKDRFFKIHVHPFQEYISNYIRKCKYWEVFMTEIFIEIFKSIKIKDYIFLDIGANIGYFSLLASTYDLPCIAFEPVPKNYNLFQKSIEENRINNIKLYPYALSNKDQDEVFNISDKNLGACSSKQINNIQETIVCKSKPLDHFIEDFPKDKKYIAKIDVEETELEVLQGMENILKHRYIKYLVLEISSYKEELFDILKRNNYSICVNAGFDDIEKIKPIDFNTMYLNNPIYYSNLDNLQREVKESFEKEEDGIYSRQRQILFIRPYFTLLDI